jgi:transcriptional regulator with XRE-family HTH domain
MHTRSTQRSTTRARNRQAGHWLRSLRERRHLSQRELAARIGVEPYTIISQLESGRGRIPADRHVAWAEALGLPPDEFVRTLMSHYVPATHPVVRIAAGLSARRDASRSPEAGMV